IMAIELRDIRGGATIVMPCTAVGKGVSILARDLHPGTNIILGGALKKLTATQWTSGSLVAPYVGSIGITADSNRNVAGDFGAQMTITSSRGGVALKRLSVAGTITGAAIAAAEGKCGTISAHGWDGGSLQAKAVKSIIVETNLSNADITLTQPTRARKLAVGKIKVGGWMDSVCLLSAGNMGNVTIGAIRNSSIFAAVASRRDDNGDGVLDLFDPQTDTFSAHAKIKSLRITSGKDRPFAIINSNIAAWQIGRFRGSNIRSEPSTVPFGLAVHTFNSLTYWDGQRNATWRQPQALQLYGTPTDANLTVRVV
ncbi:MAG: hypothetical protein HQ546_00360, partial [Planctomycetes bacterium]|nr:hypothetical protein [Planctomycetota bacterium]